MKDRIYNYISSQTVPFLILDDVLRENKNKIPEQVLDEDSLNLSVLNACQRRYKAVVGKVQRAIVRRVVFIFVTKASLALLLEGTFERVYYGRVIWSSIALNTLTPPLLMIIVGLLIKTPSRENSFRILAKISSILFDEVPKLKPVLSMQKKPKKIDPILWAFFILFWFARTER